MTKQGQIHAGRPGTTPGALKLGQFMVIHLPLPGAQAVEPLEKLGPRGPRASAIHSSTHVATRAIAGCIVGVAHRRGRIAHHPGGVAHSRRYGAFRCCPWAAHTFCSGSAH